MNLIAAAAVATLFSTCAFAEDFQFTDGQAVSLQSDRAYILVRTFGRSCGLLCGTVRFAPLLFRTLGSDELKQAAAWAQQDPDHWKDRVESNVVELSPGEPYVEKGGEDFS